MEQLARISRTNKFDLEKRVGRSLPQLHPLLSWLVVYVARMLTVRVVGPNAKTVFELFSHKRFVKRLLLLGR